YLEIKTEHSISQFIDEIWEIKEVVLYNKITDTTFSVNSEVSPLAKKIISKISPDLSY
ncbi:MAG: hypothetical protein HYV28_17370, partial [Ignavibacteriales bacterium]|nr:hypothetical protein [Ignavibacteriales bacterium]